MNIFPSILESTASADLKNLRFTYNEYGIKRIAEQAERQLESGEIFKDSVWPPIGNRATAELMKSLRSEVKTSLIESGYPESGPVSKKEGLADMHASVAFWSVLKEHFPPGEAMTKGVWWWIAIRLLPDITIWRWKGVTDSHFLSTSDMRCWPQHLWRYAWACTDDDGEIDISLHQTFSKTDMRSALLERPGQGFDKAMIQAIIRRVGFNESSNAEDTWRGMAKRLTWIRGSKETSVYSPTLREAAVEELKKWTDCHYRK